MRSGGSWSAGSCTAPSSAASWSWTSWWAAHTMMIPLHDGVGFGRGRMSPCLCAACADLDEQHGVLMLSIPLLLRWGCGRRSTCRA